LDYSAPEYVLDQKPEFLSDVFSFGCLFYEIMTGNKVLSCNDTISNYTQSIQYLQKINCEELDSNLEGAFKKILVTVDKERPNIQQGIFIYY
jgi:serine/threonine protein kinase